HGFHQLVGRDQGADTGRVHFDVELVTHHRLHAHATEQLDHGGNVVQVRQVADSDGFVGQQGRRQDRQSRVLGAGNADLAIQAVTAGDHQFVHTGSLVLGPLTG